MHPSQGSSTDNGQGGGTYFKHKLQSNNHKSFLRLSNMLQRQAFIKNCVCAASLCVCGRCRTNEHCVCHIKMLLAAGCKLLLSSLLKMLITRRLVRCCCCNEMEHVASNYVAVAVAVAATASAYVAAADCS